MLGIDNFIKNFIKYMPDTFPQNPPAEAQSFETTTYSFDGKVYSGVRSVDPIEIMSENVNVLGTQNATVRWARGKTEIPDLPVEMLEDSFNAFVKDLASKAGDIPFSKPLNNYRFDIVETVYPEEGIDEGKTRITYRNCRIKGYKRATRNESATGFTVSVTIQLSDLPEVELGITI